MCVIGNATDYVTMKKLLLSNFAKYVYICDMDERKDIC